MPAINPANSDAGRALRAQQAAARSASPQRPKLRPAAGLPSLLSAPAQAQPAQAPTRPRPRPKPKPRPKTGLAKLVNDIQYELGPKGGTGRAFRRAGRQIVRDVVKDAKQTQRNPVTAVLPIPGGALPGVGYVERNVGTAVLGAVDNAARLGYSAAQRMSGAKKADPTAGPAGAFLDQFVERGYRALGSKPPSQMSQAEVDRDQFRRSIGGGLLAAPLGTLGLAGRALQATTMAGKVGYSGAAFALNGLIANVFEDNTGGNPVNFINQATGAKLPGAVNVGQDDWVDSFWKSLAPNLGADLVVGGVVGGVVGVAGKSLRAMGVPLKHTKAHLARRWAARGETAERAEQAAAGIVRQDPESGAYAFSPPEPKPEPPKPTDAPQAAPEPWQPPPMPEQAAPEFDPWAQAYDPALPTSTGLGRAIGDLSDQELRAISTGDGPVVPRVEEALAARDQAMAMPAAPAQVLPTDVLPDEYLAALPNKWRGMADGDKPFDLAPLFDPEVNPSIWKRAQAMTGADEPGQLTPTDMADVLDAMLEDGQAVIPSRMGAEMMPVAGIRRPVPATDPTAVNPTADPWSSPSNMPDLPDQGLWDPRREGSIKIKDGPNGPEVVDGNKRLGLAQRLGVEQVPVVRDGGAPTPADAAQPRPQIELDPAERARIKQELIKAAAEGGEIRPPDAPIPAFSDMPVRRLDEVDMDKPVEPGSPEAQALLDETRLAADAMRERAAMDRAATEAARDAEGYELKTFEQKKAEGLVQGYKADPGAEQADEMPPYSLESGPFKAYGAMEGRILRGTVNVGEFDELPEWFLAQAGLSGRGRISSLEKTRLLRNFATQELNKLPAGEWLLDGSTAQRRRIFRKWFEGDDRFTVAPEHDGALVFRSGPAVLTTAPERPTPVRLASSTGDQPEFTLPPALKKPGITYGSRKIRFASDLDRAAYALLEKKNPKLQPELRAALDAAGIDPGSVVNHAIRVRKALKKSNPAGDGVIDLPAQPWESGGQRGLFTGHIGAAPDKGATPLPQDWDKITRLVDENLPELEAELRAIGGDRFRLNIVNGYYNSEEIAPWGQTETGTAWGLYKWWDDSVTLWRQTDPNSGRVAGAGQGVPVYPAFLLRAGYHEVAHRIILNALSDAEMRVLDSKLGRAQVLLMAKEFTNNLNLNYREYHEILADTVSYYLLAARAGKDPIIPMLKRLANKELSSAQLSEPWAKKAAQLLETSIPILKKVYDFAEASWNYFRNGTFRSTVSIFEDIQRGRMANTIENLRPSPSKTVVHGPNSATIKFDTMSGSARFWQAEYWNLYNIYNEILPLIQKNAHFSEGNAMYKDALKAGGVRKDAFKNNTPSQGKVPNVVDRQQQPTVDPKRSSQLDQFVKMGEAFEVRARQLRKEMSDLMDSANKGGCL